MAVSFDYIENMAPGAAARCLNRESPLLAAVVLSHLSPGVAAKVLANMNGDRQREVVGKMAKARNAPDEVVQRVSRSLRGAVARGAGKAPLGPALAAWRPRQVKGVQPANAPPPKVAEAGSPRDQLDALMARSRSRPVPDASRPAAPASGGGRVNGLALAAEILRLASPAVRQNVSEHAPQLYQQLRERMFTFDDLTMTTDEGLGRIFTRVAVPSAALALRFAPRQLLARALAAISPRRSVLLREEMEKNAAERVRVSDIEAAQQAVMDIALELQAAGEILIDPHDPDAIG